MTDNLPVPDDALWLKHAGLSKEEIEDLRKSKKELTEYGKQKLRELAKEGILKYNEALKELKDDE